MIKPLEKVNLSQIAIRELKREQKIIDYVENSKTAGGPVKITRYQRWVHWWNGKKTVIGLIGTAGGAIMMGVTKFPNATAQAVGWIGTGLFGILAYVGGIHKIFKSENFGGKGEISLDNDSFILLIKETVEIIKRWYNLIKGAKKDGK